MKKEDKNIYIKCHICGKEINDDFETIKTKRRTTIYICRNCIDNKKY